MPPTHRACGTHWVPAFAGMTSSVLHHRRPDLSPLSHPRSILPSSAAPKRDHDEWLVRRRLGGLAVVPAQARVAAGCAVACPAAVAPRTARGRGDHPRSSTSSPHGGEELPARKRPVWRHSVDLARGDKIPGRRMAPGKSPDPLRIKPKTPIGRRGVSLISLRTTRVGAYASPAPLHSLKVRGQGSLKTPKPIGLSDASACPHLPKGAARFAFRRHAPK